MSDAGHEASYSGGSGLDKEEWNALIGIVTAIVGNILISFALNIQRYAHIRIHRDGISRQKSWNIARTRQKAGKGTDYGTQMEIANRRAELNRAAPALDEEDAEHQRIYHREDEDGNGDAGERAPLRGSRTASSSSSETMGQKDEDEEEGRGQEREQNTPYLKSPYWWTGILLMTVGEAGNFLAYGFAPASIVSPLGVVALVSNCIIAPWFLKEQFRNRDFWGVMVAVGGAVTVVLSAKNSETKLGPEDLWDAITRWEFELYVGITAGLIVLLMWMSDKYGGKTILIDVGLVALFGGYTALSTKGVASLLSDTLWRALTFPVTYLLLVLLVITALFQIRYVNRALQRFDSTQVIPIQFVLFTISVIVGSAVLYRDFESATADRIGKFIGGCLLTFLGVYLITSGRPRRDIEDEEDAAEDVEEGISLVNEEASDNEVADIEVNGVKSRRESTVSEPTTPTRSRRSSNRHPARTPPQRSDGHDASQRSPPTPMSAEARSSFVESVWTSPQRRLGPRQRLEATTSSPVLTSEARMSRPSTSKQDSRRSLAQTEQQHASVSRASMSHLFPGPISSPLSSSLSAVVADTLRRGVRSPAKQRRGRPTRPRSQRGTEEGTEASDVGPEAEDGQSILPRARNRRQRASFGDALGRLFVRPGSKGGDEESGPADGRGSGDGGEGQ